MNEYCSKCGVLVNSGAGFCAACGAPISGAQSISQAKPVMPASNRQRNMIVALLAAITVIVAIGVVVQAMNSGGVVDQVKAKSAQMNAEQEKAALTWALSDINNLTQAVKLYRMDNGAFPTTEQGLAVLANKPTSGPEARNWRPYLDKLPKDPWGKNYQYVSPGKNGEPFQISSKDIASR